MRGAKTLVELVEEVPMGAAIEAPLILLEEPVEVAGVDAVELAHVSLGMVSKVFDAIDVILLIGEELRVIDSHEMKVADIKSIVGPESIGTKDAIRRNLLLKSRQKRLGFGIGNDGGVKFSAALQETENSHFPSCSWPFVLVYALEVSLTGLELARQSVPGQLAGYELTQARLKRNGGVGLNPDDLCRCTSSGPSKKVLDQASLLEGTQTIFL